jgi:hypothetical protein
MSTQGLRVGRCAPPSDPKPLGAGGAAAPGKGAGESGNTARAAAAGAAAAGEAAEKLLPGYAGAAGAARCTRPCRLSECMHAAPRTAQLRVRLGGGRITRE